MTYSSFIFMAIGGFLSLAFFIVLSAWAFFGFVPSNEMAASMFELITFISGPALITLGFSIQDTKK